MPLVLKNAKLFDGSGTLPGGPVTVVADGDRISFVGPAVEVSVPENAEVIECEGKFLMPGMVDSHIHITGSGDPNFLKSAKELVPHTAIRASLNAKKTLEAGFTAIRDAGAGSLIDVALKKAVNEGLVPGPRMQVACHGLSITGGHGDTRNGWPPEVLFAGRYVVDSPDEARRAAREQLRDGADHLKLHATGGVMSEGDEIGRAHV